MERADDRFFEMIVGILPVHVPKLSPSELVRTIQVLTSRGLGSDRLFNNYLYLQVERKIYDINGTDYCTLLRSLVDRQFFEDTVFWQDFIWDYLSEDEFGNSKGNFTNKEALVIWDTLIACKAMCPSLPIH